MNDNESSLYYLQSRYYDPSLGRFINADAFASTGQGLLGNNMFSYCNNNPVSFMDASGQALKPCTTFINDGAKAEEAPLPPPDEDIIEATVEYYMTSSVGFAGSLQIGPWVLGVQGFATFDTEGNIAIQYSYFSGICAGANASSISYSLTPIVMITDAQRYDQLNGQGFQAGVSIGGLFVDYVGVLDGNGKDILYDGVVIGFGGSAPDVHVTWGETGTLFAMEADWDLFYQATGY